MLEKLEKQLLSTIVDKTISFDTDLLQAFDLHPVFERHQLSSTSTIANATISKAQNRLSLSGMTDLYGQPSAPIVFHASESSGDLICSCEITLPRWTFSSTRLALPSQKRFVEQHYQTADNLLSLLVLEDVTLRFENPGNDETTSGFTLLAKGVLDPRIAHLLPWLDAQQSMALRGHTAFHNDLCSLILEIPLPLPELAKQVGLQRARLTIDSTTKGGINHCEAAAVISADWQMGNIRGEFSSTLGLENECRHWVLNLRMEDDTEQTLTTAMKALGIELGSAQMPLLDLLPDIRPQLISVSIDLDHWSLSSISLYLELASPWRVIDQQLEMPSAAIQFTINNPTNNPTFVLTGSGDLTLNELPMRCSFSSLDSVIRLVHDEPIIGRDFLQQYLPVIPIRLPDIQRVDVVVDPRECHLSFSLTLQDGYLIPLANSKLILQDTSLGFQLSADDSISAQAQLLAGAQIADISFFIQASVGSSVAFLCSANRLDMRKLLAECFGVTDIEWLDVQLDNVLIECQSQGNFRLSSDVNVDLSVLLHKLGTALPFGASRVPLDHVELEYQHASKSWHISLTMLTAVNLSDSDQFRINLKKASLTLGASSNQPLAIDISLLIDGDIQPSPEFGIRFSDMAISWRSQDSRWHCSGNCSGDFFAQQLSLGMSIDVSTSSKLLTFALQKHQPLVNWPGVGSVTLDELCLSASQAIHGDSKQPWEFSVNGSLPIIIADTLDLVAAPSFHRSATGYRLDLMAPAPEQPLRIEIPLPLSPAPSVLIELKPLRIGYQSLKEGNKGVWFIDAGATLTIADVPFPADRVIANDTMSGALKIDDQGIKVTFSPPGDNSLKLNFAADSGFALSLPDINIQSLFVQRTSREEKKSRWTLGAELKALNFDRLNRLFADAPVFMNSVDFMLTLGDGLSIKAISSPFQKIPLRPGNNGATWTQWCDFTGIGTLSFQVPEFAFDFSGGRWCARGGVETQGELSIPITPVKWLANKCGVPDQAMALLPDALPLIELKLDEPDFYQQLSRLMGTQSPEITRAFDELSDLLLKGVERLPTTIREYLSLSIPTGFTFDVAVEPSGGAAFAINTAGDPPLKLLLPSVSGLPPLPSLVGLTVHRCGFGLTSGGTLGVLKFDGWFDQVDLVSLIYALSSGKGSDLGNRLIMRDTLALIPMAAPMPIPLFYREFGWELKNMLGLGLEFHASFPDPEPTLIDWITLIASLLNFFQHSDYYLHDEGHLPAGMALPFTLGPSLIKLPDYLGGGSLGTKQALPALSVSDTLARALDGIKTGNAGWVIQSVPLKYQSNNQTHWIRIGSQTIHFGPLDIIAGWCISTEEEFRDDILADPDALELLATSNAEQMLDCLPAQMGGKAYDKGFVVMLLGGLDISCPLANIFSFRCQFGIALLGPGDFETALRLVGAFGPKDMLSLTIEGRIQTQLLAQGQVKVGVNGEVCLMILGQPFALGSTLEVIPGKSLYGDIRLRLSEYIQIKGSLQVNPDGARIAGQLCWSGIGGDSGQFETQTIFSKQGIEFVPVIVKIGGFNCTTVLKLPGTSPGALFSMGASLELPESFIDRFKAGLKATAKEVVSAETSAAYDRVIKLISSQQDLQASLTGLKAWLPPLCEQIIKEIKRATTQKKIYAAMDKWAGRNWFRKGAVAIAKQTNVRANANRSAAPWIKKLTTLKTVAGAPLDKRYRARLKTALEDLGKNNTIEVKVGRIGKFPGVRVYKRGPVINKTQLRKIQAGVRAIDALPTVSKDCISAQSVLHQLPKKEQLLADIQHSIEQGLEQGIPSIHSLGFDASAGLFVASNIILTIVIHHEDREIKCAIPADLTSPDKVALSISKALADVL
ncbi:hypothetical protein MIB92_16670 [Aestuariirhabdus sp. Z084]|uniref:hypothetical protein n=1 Tax=Aestuariirhabdus haliotis TaxID=2918751 RepID=UPI0020BD88D4|nr:hypothetical protein [Aestuariirhabdus haliotis]MCL6417295.1 hypothetical protein [Aestuariirhabdus haliotis]